VGAVLAAAYLLSGSIYVGMALHALMDLHSGHLMMRAYERETELGREAAAVSEWTAEGGAPDVPRAAP
jgi:membrane protease YdiL (CAAX protease family)